MGLENELIVLKFGTTSVCDSDTLEIREDWIKTVAKDIKELQERGNKLIVFSSGGLATGKKNLSKKETDSSLMESKKILGVLGLSELLYKWQKNFETEELLAATIAMRNTDIDSTNVCELIQTLIGHGIVPIINENIGLQEKYDNDGLASQICRKIGATLFVLFTDTDGVFTDNPKSNPDAKHIKQLKIDTKGIVVDENENGLGTGGMKAKLQSAIQVKKGGIKTIIANGTSFHPVENLKKSDRYTELIE